VEVRLSAEDPGRDFAPTPGLIRHWLMPAGAGIRVDTAAAAGDRVPPEYDNLVAKVMVHGADRSEALNRLAAALATTEVGGIQTTLPFHRFVAGHPGFRSGEVSTGWVAEHWDGPAAASEAGELARLAAALSVGGRSRLTGKAEASRPAAVSLISRPSWGDGVPGDGTGSWAEAALAAMVDRWPAS
jgi:3-methylcrotonyl-CoA carboxylase alpha subunit